MQLLNIKNNIIIGTAQLGTSYGIANKTEKIIIEDKIKFLNYCYQKNYDYFDTAYDYENSHKIIGTWIKNNDVTPKLSTKIPDINKYPNKNIELLFKACLKKLNVNKIKNLFLHKPSNWNNLYLRKYIKSLLNKNIISNFGLSIYEKEDIVIDSCIKIIQLPRHRSTVVWSALLPTVCNGVKIARCYHLPQQQQQVLRFILMLSTRCYGKIPYALALTRVLTEFGWMMVLIIKNSQKK